MLCETNLYRRNLIKGTGTWKVLLLKYPGPFLEWSREEIRQMAKNICKLMMKMHKCLQSRADIDRLYVSRKEGRRDFASIKYCNLQCFRVLDRCNNSWTLEIHMRKQKKNINIRIAKSAGAAEYTDCFSAEE